MLVVAAQMTTMKMKRDYGITLGLFVLGLIGVETVGLLWFCLPVLEPGSKRE